MKSPNVGKPLALAICTVDDQTAALIISKLSTLQVGVDCVIVYNGPPKNLFHLENQCSKIANVTLLHSSPFNLSKARNLAWKHSKSEWLLFVDDDATFNVDLFSNCMREISDFSDEIVIFGGKVVLSSSVKIPRLMRPLLSELDHGPNSKILGHEFVNGALFGVRTAFLERVGGFNESLGRQNGTLLSGEESELIWKARGAGLKVMYASSIEVLHTVPASRLSRDFVWRRVMWEEVTQSAIRSSLGFSLKSRSSRNASNLDVLAAKKLGRLFRRLLG